MSTNVILDFLNDLNLNNSSEWMKKNKNRCEEAKNDFAKIVQALIIRISNFDPLFTNLNAKDMIYRLNRDIRFSNDKSPYNPTFRAHISPAGRCPIPVGYFIYITPGNILLGGGMYTSQLPEATKLIRKHIMDNSDDFLEIINNPDFSANFTIQGEKLKNIPKEFPDTHLVSEYLKYKSWDIFYHIEDSYFMQPDVFIDKAIEKIILMKPFNDFINSGLSGKIPNKTRT